MKTFEVRVTQELKGFYEGYLEIEAKSEKDALAQLKAMTTEEIDNSVDWQHMDEYEGDHTTILIDLINEI